MYSAELPPMARAYEPAEVEQSLYDLWLKGGHFQPRIDSVRQPFSIIQPPPNVTGELHLGHALTASIQDCLTRWHRMKGDPTLWLPGLDHAGIATQNIVEKALAKEGISRQELGRERFVQRVWEWVAKYRHLIDEQHKRLGVSCDWERQSFTMDEGPQRAVRTTFKRLYEDELIYRGKRIINWCPRCQTALSELEVERREHEGHLWYTRYPLLNEEGAPSDEHIVVATTRPETIVADVAIAVSPESGVWRGATGRTAVVPVMGRQIPVLIDSAVDPKFGTGALKVTPGHDPVDFEIGNRHDLPTIVAIGEDGTMNDHAGLYKGLERMECRRRIVADIDRAGLLQGVKAYKNSIGHCQRCDSVVEPILSNQWFVRMEPLARPAIQAVADGRIKITPRRFARVYLHWMENIHDWCISRQLWWGHRIPIWYCDSCGNQASAVEDPARCNRCGDNRPRQDTDVLDTWFSSGLWPHSTLGWPDDTKELDYFYPTSVMETGYDILFFWVARMIMLGLYNTGEVPFHRVYLHGLIRDNQGRKMTKSLGNVVDPLEASSTYGTDALRFALITGGTPGNDFRLTEERLAGGRNFANKIWNAGRFIMQYLDGQPPLTRPEIGDETPLEDRWIMSRSQRTVAEVSKLLGRFQIGEASHRLYDFFWSEFADWYIEMAKVRLVSEGRPSPLPTLAYVMDLSLRLLHPFMPFVTEEIWQRLRSHLSWSSTTTLIIVPWPKPDRALIDNEAEDKELVVMDVIRSIRNIRAEKKVDASRYVEAYVAAAQTKSILNDARPLVETLARARPLHLIDQSDTPPKQSVTAILPQAQVTLPIAGLVDAAKERSRLEQKLAETRARLKHSKDKLANDQFRSKAPTEVVAKEKERLATAQSQVQRIEEQLQELS